MISVIIVTYSSAAHIARCLESLAPTDAELIVVDNASRDGTVDAVRKFPRVKLIEPGANLGFAGGCNFGARQSNGEFLLFLNPDTALRSSLAPMERALQNNPNCVAVGAQLVDASGRPQRGFQVRRFPSTTALVFEMLLINRLLPNNPVNRRYRSWDMDPTQPANVDQPAGAALMVQRSAFEAVGGFDERFYPLWFEDVDLCLRL
ncbi:MAG: glycosyltransferase family 2 protein, partial [Acidobacteria bacterium]|nr:glycosyltransferase family 2 protein [Acidobacteriota bacterium]